MNFEFLKGLTGMGYVYENCSNAEKLAMNMPVQSVFTSRKSAELLAKFIYLTAHNQEVEMLTFADILSDSTVQKFINSRQVINAFHHIRKSGNRAVHSDDQENPEEAVTVLHDLHFVAGETARILGLIRQYPKFDDRIEPFADATFVDEKDIETKAREMFLQYVEKYDAQKERDNYYNQRVDRLLDDFDEYCAPIQIIPSIQELYETIEFKNKIILESTLKQIQEHFIFMGIQYIKYLRGEIKEDIVFKYSCKLTVRGENAYTTTDLFEFIQGIRYDLSESDGFIIESHYTGPSLWTNKDVREEFSLVVPQLDKQEHFTYRDFEYLDLSGEVICAKFENGEWIDLKALCSPDIADKDFDQDWCSNQLVLKVDFDFDRHPDILEALHGIVRKYLSPEDLPYSENCWEDEDYNTLVNGANWDPRKLRDIQNFLDEANAILKPILPECSGSGEGGWYISKPPFAYGTWEWTTNGFRIIGTEL